MHTHSERRAGRRRRWQAPPQPAPGTRSRSACPGAQRCRLCTGLCAGAAGEEKCRAATPFQSGNLARRPPILAHAAIMMLLMLFGLRERAGTNRVLEAEGMQALWRHGHDSTLCYATGAAQHWKYRGHCGSRRQQPVFGTRSVLEHLGDRALLTLRAAQSATSP